MKLNIWVLLVAWLNAREPLALAGHQDMGNGAFGLCL